MKTIFFWEYNPHIRECWINLSGSNNTSKSSSNQYRRSIWSKKGEWVSLSNWREDNRSHQIHVIFIWQKRWLHTIDQSSECWSISKCWWFNLSARRSPIFMHWQTRFYTWSVVTGACSSRYVSGRFFVLRRKRLWRRSSPKSDIIAITKNMIHKKISEK